MGLKKVLRNLAEKYGGVLAYLSVFPGTTFRDLRAGSRRGDGRLFYLYLRVPLLLHQPFQGFSAAQFGWVFGINSCALILGNQVNRMLLTRYRGTSIIVRALSMQSVLGLVMLIGTLTGLLTRTAAVSLIISYTFCFSFVTPNAIAQALLPFSQNVGSAAAAYGASTMISGALASALLSYLQNGTGGPMAYMMTGCAVVALGFALVARPSQGPVTRTPGTCLARGSYSPGRQRRPVGSAFYRTTPRKS